MTSIEENAFAGCIGLTSVVIPNSVTTIQRDAFWDCTGLTSVTIGSGVTSVDNWIFQGCTSLTTIISLIENPDATIGLFVGDIDFSNITLYVPKGTKTLYEKCNGWKNFSNIVELEETNGIRNMEAVVEGQMVTSKEFYDLNGRRISEPQRGLNILRMGDGTVRKVVIK